MVVLITALIIAYVVASLRQHRILKNPMAINPFVRQNIDNAPTTPGWPAVPTGVEELRSGSGSTHQMTTPTAPPTSSTGEVEPDVFISVRPPPINPALQLEEDDDSDVFISVEPPQPVNQVTRRITRSMTRKNKNV